jgi:hypothetical protein
MVALVVRFSEEPVSTLAAILFIRLLKRAQSSDQKRFCRFSVSSLICTKNDGFDFQTDQTEL